MIYVMFFIIVLQFITAKKCFIDPSFALSAYGFNHISYFVTEHTNLAIALFLLLTAAVGRYFATIMINKKLRRQVEEAVKRNREKDRQIFAEARRFAVQELITNISHQWRQPISNVSALMQCIEDHEESVREPDQFILNSVNRAVKELDKLSSSLDIFNKESETDANEESFSLTEAAAKTIALFRENLDVNRINIFCFYSDDIKIKGCCAEFINMLIYLVSNANDALGFRQENDGWIKIVIWPPVKGGKARISVEDNGGGIKLKEPDIVFDPYFTTKHRSHEKGMGLFYCKRIAEFGFNGKVFLKNTANGAEFTIEVPCG